MRIKFTDYSNKDEHIDNTGNMYAMNGDGC